MSKNAQKSALNMLYMNSLGGLESTYGIYIIRVFINPPNRFYIRFL